MIELYVDGDACPVKDEIFRVAKRYGLKVHLVANTSLRIPRDPLFEMVVVRGGQLDVADDWIAERVTARDIAITSDLPLAARCLAKGARVLDSRGKVFSDDAMGEALATRELMAQLRDMGVVSGGPAPFEARDRSRFLQSLDTLIQALKKSMR
ncbi:MAG: YaiI/YqxD family protein [Holophagaceae bacterium]|nr:YaiI/YqxD family protein [Holophagaceae bacterium]